MEWFPSRENVQSHAASGVRTFTIEPTKTFVSTNYTPAPRCIEYHWCTVPDLGPAKLRTSIGADLELLLYDESSPQIDRGWQAWND
jgi:hypothetical protein